MCCAHVASVNVCDRKFKKKKRPKVQHVVEFRMQNARKKLFKVQRPI